MLLKIIKQINILVYKTGQEYQLQFPEYVQIVNKSMGKKCFCNNRNTDRNSVCVCVCVCVCVK